MKKGEQGYIEKERESIAIYERKKESKMINKQLARKCRKKESKETFFTVYQNLFVI